MPGPTDRRYTDRIVFLHGFTQTHHHWHRVALALADAIGSAHARPTVALVDLPGHGLSRSDRSTIYDIAARLPLVAGAGTYVGYSMGGRFALLAAANADPAVERLVLIGATPGIDDDDERGRRATADAEHAERLEREGVPAFLGRWLDAPMFADLPQDPDGLDHRLRNTPDGLSHSLRTCGTGDQTPIWDRLGAIEIPVLVIAGADDEKFTRIGTRMTERLPRATFTAIAGAGHAAHSVRPELVTAAIADWLAAH